MKRRKSTVLRGSVTQSGPTVRMRAKPPAMRFGLSIRIGAALGSCLLLVGLAIWLWHIGWPQQQAQRAFDAGLRLTQRAHFAVKDIAIEGRQQTSKEALMAALELSADKPILGFDVAAAQARIARLPWVATAIVERRLPDSVVVRLTERVPLARWQHDNRTVVIDAAGLELSAAKPEDFAQLPLLVGAGAPDDAASLLANLRDFPDIGGKLIWARRAGERRWDLYLQPKVLVKLPETNMRDALTKLQQQIIDRKILELNISAIDLRMPDRMVIESASPVAGRAGGEAHL